MNLFPVNGGLLNGSRLLVVAASAAIACSSTFAAAAVRGQGALAPVSSGASFRAQPTHTHDSYAALGGETAAIFRAGHSHSAQASIDAKAELRSFVFRAVAAQADVVGRASVVIIPASVLGSSQASPNTASVLADATKTHPGRSSAAGAAQVAIEAAPIVQRFVAAQALAGSGGLYAETTINGVVASYANISAVAGLYVNTTGILRRMATAPVEGCSVVTARATHIQKSHAAASGGGYAFFAEPHLFIGGLVRLAPTATVTAAAARGLRADAVPTGTAGFLASAVVAHNSTSATSHGLAGVSADATRAAKALTSAACAASVSAQAVRFAVAVGDVAGDAEFAAAAVRTTYAAVLHPGSEAALQAAPDTTIREAEARVEAGVDMPCNAHATRFAHAIASAYSDVSARAVRALPSLAEAQSAAAWDVQAVRVLEAESWALVPWCWFEATPDVTVRDGAAVAETAADGDVLAEIARMAQSELGASAEVSSLAERRVFAAALLDGAVSLGVAPTSNPFSYDPDDRTFVRPATTTGFTRTAQVTEFRRPA